MIEGIIKTYISNKNMPTNWSYIWDFYVLIRNLSNHIWRKLSVLWWIDINIYKIFSKKKLYTRFHQVTFICRNIYLAFRYTTPFLIQSYCKKLLKSDIAVVTIDIPTHVMSIWTRKPGLNIGEKIAIIGKYFYFFKKHYFEY